MAKQIAEPPRRRIGPGAGVRRGMAKGKIAKKPTLTVREQRIVANVLAGMSAGRAITGAGGNPTSHSYRRRLQPGGDLWSAAVEALEEEGVTLHHIAKRVKESLDAKETKFFTHKGRVQETRDVVAHGIRLDAAEAAFRAYRIYPAPKDSAETGPVAVNVHIRLTEPGAPRERDITPNTDDRGASDPGRRGGLGPLLRSLGLPVRPGGGDGAGPSGGRVEVGDPGGKSA
jgi:hypothetical protein